MTTIGYNDIENVLLSLKDPNTGGVMTEVPGVSSPKINATTSVYNQSGGSGIAGWSTNVNWSATDYNTVSWGSGSVYLPDGTELVISSGNTGDMSTLTYIYYDQSDSLVHTTTSAGDSVGEKKILLCVAAPTTNGKDAEFQAFGTDKQSTFITADNIAANSITANEIQSNSIETRHLDAYSVTANKMDIDYLSAISANLGDITAGTITGTTITAGSTSSAGIKLYPSGNTGYLDFYYNGSRVGRIRGLYNSGVGAGLLSLNGSYILLDGDTYMLNRDVLDLSQAKLRIPVGTDLY